MNFGKFQVWQCKPISHHMKRRDVSNSNNDDSNSNNNGDSSGNSNSNRIIAS